jgi:hypothetical protein
MLEYLQFLGLIQVVGCFVLFPVAYAVLRRRFGAHRATDGVEQPFDLLVRGSRVRAFPVGAGRFKFSVGFAFAVLFYWLLPFWIWRYGAKRTFALITVPLVCAFLLTKFVVAHLFILSSWSHSMLVSAILLIPLRVATGVYVGKRDRALRLQAFYLRGWTVGLAGAMACSEAEAVAQYNRVDEPPKAGVA